MWYIALIPAVGKGSQSDKISEFVYSLVYIVPGQPELQSKTLSQKNNQANKNNQNHQSTNQANNNKTPPHIK